MIIPFVGGSYEAYSKNLNSQTCVNFYPELSPNGKSVSALYNTPGLDQFIDLGAETIRGGIVVNELLYIVHKNKFYEINNAGAQTSRGTLNTSEGVVSIAHNGTQICIVDGTNGYIYTIATTTLTQISDVDFPNGCTSVTFLASRFVTDSTTTGRLYWSALLDGTNWSGLSYATAEADPDSIKRVISNNGQLYLFGADTLEPWFTTTDTSLPYSPIGGAAREWGTSARWSVAKTGDTLVWLSVKNGGYKIVMLNGIEPVPISTPALEYAVASYNRDYGISDAEAYSYTEAGHTFYVISFPTANKTWVYDINSGHWHERRSGDSRHLSRFYFHFINYHIVSDYSTGKLYKMRNDIYTDNGSLIKRERRAEAIYNENKPFFIGEIQVDFEAGVGNNSTVNPIASLRYSKDGGHTWSNKKHRPVGKKGEYSKRAIWRRQGRSYNRVYELSVSDPVKWVITGATIEA